MYINNSTDDKLSPRILPHLNMWNIMRINTPKKPEYSRQFKRPKLEEFTERALAKIDGTMPGVPLST